MNLSGSLINTKYNEKTLERSLEKHDKICWKHPQTCKTLSLLAQRQGTFQCKN